MNNVHLTNWTIPVSTNKTLYYSYLLNAEEPGETNNYLPPDCLKYSSLSSLNEENKENTELNVLKIYI